MTNEIEVVLPLIREGFTDATITKWFVKVGDKINEDTPLAEVAADKIVVEIKKGNRFSKSNIDQVLEYLKMNNFKLAILINFGNEDVVFKRIINFS